MKKYIVAIIKYIYKHPALIIIIPGTTIIIYSFIMIYKLEIESKDFYVNLTTSAIEVFLLGFIIIAYNKLSERKDRIKRYLEEIDSYRPWKGKEATYRISGLVRSLNNIKVTKIDLSICYLSKAPLRYANLQGADLYRTNLEGADLCGSNLQNADLRHSNLKRATLDFVSLQEAIVETKDWIEKLGKDEVKGVEKIKKKYFVVEDKEKFDGLGLRYRIKEKKD